MRSFLACIAIIFLSNALTFAQSADEEQQELDQATSTKIKKDGVTELNAMLIRDYLLRVESLEKKLEELAKETGKVETVTALLMQDDRGKRLASKDVAVRAFVNFSESPLASKKQIALHQANVEPLRQGLVGYSRVPQLFDPAEAPECSKLADERAWVDAELRKVEERQTFMTALVRLAPKKLEVKSLPTLEERITELKSTMIQQEVKAIDAAREESRLKGIEDKASAASLRESENAKSAVQKQLQLMNLELEKARAELAVLNSEKKAAIQKIDQAARRKEKLTKLEDTKVRKKLRPFMAKGFWQPGSNTRSATLKKGPMSLSALEQFGALNSGHQGLAQLLAAANGSGMGNHVNMRPRYNISRTYSGTYVNRKHIDTDRPKWSYPKDFQTLTAEQLIEVQEVQDLLIELGPLMVEEGMLAP